MTDITGADGLERAREAASRRDWPATYDLLVDADATDPLGPEDLALLAEASYATGRLEATITAWERIHAAALVAGDRLAAAGAAVRVAVHLLIDTGLLAPIRGWTKRAERLLEGMDDTPVHAWLAMVRTYERFISGDYASARPLALKAIELGTEQGVPEPAAFGRLADARIQIFEGNVEEGLALLDEAAVAVVSGELDQMAVGMLYCELLCALQGLAQNDRAEEWTKAYERWRREHDVGSLGGRCRLHRAELLRQRGECADAEAEAQLACDELRPYLRLEFGWPLTELGNIKLRLGDLEGAEEAFVAAHEIGWEPQPGLALLRLAQGDVAAAAASIADALEHPLNVPSKELPPNTDLRRAPLLEAQVEIAIAAGDVEQALHAADELERVASKFASKVIEASAALSRGRVHLASGETAAARREFDRSRLLWSEVPAPYEAAIARMGLADAYRTEGNEDRARLELNAACSTFERIGASIQADLGRRASGDRVDDMSSRGQNVFRCEGDHWSIAYEGRTFTVRHLRGLQYLGRLLAEPGREFHVLDLASDHTIDPDAAGATEHTGLSTPGDAGVLLDDQAKQSYRRRLADIDEDLEEANAFGDTARATRARAERDFLVRELSRAVGLGGRDRHAGSASERARASVTQAVRHAMARIRKQHPDLGEHLDRTVRTGTYCVYLPDTRAPAVWTS